MSIYVDLCRGVLIHAEPFQFKPKFSFRCKVKDAPRVMPTGFNLKVAAKPARAIACSPASLSTPPLPKKASELIIEEGPRPPKLRRRQPTAECVVTIYPYSHDAATVWESCNQPGMMLWQVQLDHNARNSITIGFYESFTKFLQQEDYVPQTL